MLSDTTPEAARVQIELLRKAAPLARVNMMRSMTRMAVGMCRRAIARANPGLSQQELDLRFVELNYGKELADELRQHFRGAGHVPR